MYIIIYQEIKKVVLSYNHGRVSQTTLASAIIKEAYLNVGQSADGLVVFWCVRVNILGYSCEWRL
jgi:hypothetical protein